MSTKRYKRVGATIIETAVCLSAGMISLAFAQSTATTYPNLVTASAAKSPALPSYVVYHHFLAWASALDQDAKTRGLTDPYAFAHPFSRSIGFSNHELDLVRNHAKLLGDDLTQQDAKAAAVVTAYRQSAQAALRLGQPLPPAPAKIQELEQQKTAMMIHHYVLFRSELGPAQSSKLDTYLSREFMPHTNVAPLSASNKKSGPASNASTNPFSIKLH